MNSPQIGDEFATAGELNFEALDFCFALLVTAGASLLMNTSRRIKSCALLGKSQSTASNLTGSVSMLLSSSLSSSLRLR